MWSFKKTWTKLIVYLPVGVACSSKMKMCAFWPYLLQKYYAFSHVHLPHNHQHQWSVPLNHWCSPRDQGLGLEAPRGQKLKSWSWIMKSILVLNIWSWSRSWRKSLAVFQDLSCNSWWQWARHTMAFCLRQQKLFAIRKPLFERTIYAPCTSVSVEWVFNNGAIC